MALGPRIRRLFGPYERNIADSYRSLFTNLDDLAEVVQRSAPEARNILEVGCGEGAMTERLSRLYPNTSITAIDIVPRLGRLYRGESQSVQFIQATAADVATEKPHIFDLVLLADVLHHVPVSERVSLLKALRQAMSEDGVFVFKDWAQTGTPIHTVCSLAERYITGDRVIYYSAGDLERLAQTQFGSPTARATIRPWNNNVVWIFNGTNPAS